MHTYITECVVYKDRDGSLYIGYRSICTSYFVLLSLDNHGARNKLALVQYMFDGPEIEVITRPHGNSKGSTPYFRTSDSARENLHTLAATKTPKAVIQAVTQEAGGELNIESPSDGPRNRQQISNIRRSTTGRDKNVLYSVMLECKATQGSEGTFVRDVKAAPSPQCVLFFDWQLQDMIRFLTNNKKFGIFTADITYNLGEFYVTPTAYPHLMLEILGGSNMRNQVGFRDSPTKAGVFESQFQDSAVSWHTKGLQIDWI